jgi:hypothetical protein
VRSLNPRLSHFWLLLYLFLNLFPIRLPAALPAIPPIVPLKICPSIELPNAILVPAATPDPTLAPKIDSPAHINPAVLPVKTASPPAEAPPVYAAAPTVPAIAPIFSIGILFPNFSGPFICYFVFGIFGTCGVISFNNFYMMY